jgi:hypothetical protein
VLIFFLFLFLICCACVCVFFKVQVNVNLGLNIFDISIWAIFIVIGPKKTLKIQKINEG